MVWPAFEPNPRIALFAATLITPSRRLVPNKISFIELVDAFPPFAEEGADVLVS